MNKKIKHYIGLILFALALIPMTNVKALNVSNEGELKAALASGGDVTLTQNIAITSPLIASIDAVIDGGGYVLSSDPAFVNDGANGSILAVLNGAEVEIKNITIDGAKKYGVQCYDGGIALFNGVTITNSSYGAVLLNGGGAGIINLHLENNHAGIEFGKGINVNNEPALMMAGKITGNQTDLLVIANNDNLGEVTVGNNEGSEMKLAIDGKKLVLKDKDNNIVATSNEAKLGVTVKEEEATPTPTPTPTPNPDNTVTENPNTGDNVIAYAILSILGTGALLVSSKKLLKNN